MSIELDYRKAIALIRIINRYLADHPTGESAEEAKRIKEELKTITRISKE